MKCRECTEIAFWYFLSRFVLNLELSLDILAIGNLLKYSPTCYRSVSAQIRNIAHSAFYAFTNFQLQPVIVHNYLLLEVEFCYCSIYYALT